jgi:hypothetical protein
MRSAEPGTMDSREHPAEASDALDAAMDGGTSSETIL